MQTAQITKLRPDRRLFKASLITIHDDIEEGNVILFEGLAPRGLICQFKALIEHYNRQIAGKKTRT